MPRRCYGGTAEPPDPARAPISAIAAPAGCVGRRPRSVGRGRRGRPGRARAQRRVMTERPSLTGSQRDLHAGIGGGVRVEGPQRGRRGVVLAGDGHAASPEDVVHQDHAAGRQARHDLLVVVDVVGLVGVDEGEVHRWLGRQAPQRLQRRGDAQVDAVGHAGSLPVRPGDGGPLLGDVAAQQPPARRQSLGDRQGRVARERPDLHRETRSQQPDQHRHERTLHRVDLHPPDVAERLGGRDEILLHLVGRAGMGVHVGRAAPRPAG